MPYNQEDLQRDTHAVGSEAPFVAGLPSPVQMNLSRRAKNGRIRNEKCVENAIRNDRSGTLWQQAKSIA